MINKFFRYTLPLVIIILASLLQGCFTAAGTAVVGGVIIYQRKAIENVVNDQHIKMQINNTYFRDGQLWEQNRVVVTSVNGYVLLTGEVRTAALQQKALALANDVPGIVKIYNQINIGKPVSLVRQTLDASITTIIKTKMLFAANFDPTRIKVLTNNGVVYLIGIANPQQSDRAAAIASQTAGVKKVVKVFQYIT